jgi:DNA-directed RNA polymerase subunit RPC12/RpoP
MSIIGNISSFGLSASNKMKDTAEIVKTSGYITDLKKQLAQTYEEIGKCLCTMEPNQYKDTVSAMIQQAKEYKSQLESLEQQLESLKGKVKCPQCGTSVKCGLSFCSSCGYHFEAQSMNTCIYCGSMLTPEQQFCTQCGKPVPTNENNEEICAGTHNCANCGNQVENGLKFCKYCGTQQN